MITVVLVIHLIIATSLVAVILLQRSEGGALSGLGGGTFGGLMSARGSANLLTRATAILAATFIVTSMLLAILASYDRGGASVLDRPAVAPGLGGAAETPGAGGSVPVPEAPAPAAPGDAAPAEPAPPIAR